MRMQASARNHQQVRIQGFGQKCQVYILFAVVNCDISQILTYLSNMLLSVQDKSVQLRTSQEQNVKNMDHSVTTPEVVTLRGRHVYKTGTGHVLDPSKDCYVLPNVRIQYQKVNKLGLLQGEVLLVLSMQRTILSKSMKHGSHRRVMLLTQRDFSSGVGPLQILIGCFA